MSNFGIRPDTRRANSVRPVRFPLAPYALVAFAAVAVFALSKMLPREFVLPAASAVLLISAGAIALVAYALRVRVMRGEIGLWDSAGAYALFGFAAGMMSGSQNIIGLFGHLATNN